MESKKKLSGKEKFAYGIGAVGKDMVYMLSASYILYYYQDILGVMTSFVRDGKEHAADAGGCLLYAKLWYMLYPVRSLWKRLKMRIRNIIHK